MKLLSYSIALCLLTCSLAKANPLVTKPVHPDENELPEALQMAHVTLMQQAMEQNATNKTLNSPATQNSSAAKPSTEKYARNLPRSHQAKSYSSTDTRKCCNPAPVSCPTFAISSVPFVVPANGHYIIPNSLTYNGTGTAITIPSTVDNVTIEFCDGADLILTGTGTSSSPVTGILVQNVNSDTTILNAQIIGLPNFALFQRGIDIESSSNVAIINPTVANFRIGIRASKSSNVDIVNSKSTNCRTHIFLTQANSINCSNIETSNDTSANAWYGIFTTFSNNISIVNAHITNSTLSQIAVNGGRDIFIDQVLMTGFSPALSIQFPLLITGAINVLVQNITASQDAFSSGGYLYAGAFPFALSNVNITLRNCTLFQLPIYAGGLDLIMEDISCIAIDPSTLGPVCQLGSLNPDGTPGDFCQNVTIRNCNFNCPVQPVQGEVFEIVWGDGIIVDNCTFNYIGTGPNDPSSCVEPISMKMAIGNDGSIICPNSAAVTNCRISNCTFSSTTPSSYGITIVGGGDNTQGTSGINQGIVFENCSINNCLLDGILVENTMNSSIIGCNIQNCAGNAIHIGTGATGCSILNSQVTNNPGNGITIEANSTANHIQGNNAFNNGGTGLNNVTLANNTEWYYNSSCNNGTNMNNIPKVVAPGGVPVVGQNIDCLAD